MDEPRVASRPVDPCRGIDAEGATPSWIDLDRVASQARRPGNVGEAGGGM